MNTIKIIPFFLLMLISGFIFSQGKIQKLLPNPAKDRDAVYINVDSNGQYKTLEDAYDAITSPGTVTYHVVLQSDIELTDHGAKTLEWEKKGTAEHPIYIYSEGFDRKRITRPQISANTPMLHFIRSEYVYISYIHFHNCPVGIWFDNTDHCSISYCRITGDHEPASVPFRSVISTVVIPDDDDLDSIAVHGLRSEYNSIAYNLIENTENILLSDSGNFRMHNSIYISQGSRHNSVWGNTVRDIDGAGIALYHGWIDYNLVKNNIVDHDNDYYDDLYSSCIEMRHQCDTFNCHEYTINNYTFTICDTICREKPYGNTVINNFVYRTFPKLTEDFPDDILDGNGEILWDDSLTNINTISLESNHLFYGETVIKQLHPYPIFELADYKLTDPYWLDYNPKKMVNKPISGDFDGDGYDDIASFYKKSNTEVGIDLWMSNDQTSKAFDFYQDAWEYPNWYPADNFEDRIIAGDFDEDGKDEIAVIFFYGSGDTRIHVWNLNTSTKKFEPSSWNPGWWKSTGSYTAYQIDNKVVSGDFNNDGKDDIAAFYDDWGQGVYLHVFLSYGSGFYAPRSWWQKHDWYPSENIEGRVVSADFSGDGKDDIAALFDYGSTMRIHVFRSTGVNFSYQGNMGWGSYSGFEAENVTNHVVTGDFNGDFNEDIGVFYKDDLEGSTFKFFSNLNNAQFYTIPETMWTGEWYPQDYIGGRLVSGKFNEDHRADIVTFFQYDEIHPSVRSHVFKSNVYNDLELHNGFVGNIWRYINSVTPLGGKKGYEEEEKIEEIIKTGFTTSPNPFKTATKISYELTESAPVNLRIFSMSGREVKSFNFENQPKGNHEIIWTGKDFADNSCKSGVYIVVLNIGNQRYTKKIVIIRN